MIGSVGQAVPNSEIKVPVTFDVQILLNSCYCNLSHNLITFSVGLLCLNLLTLLPQIVAQVFVVYVKHGCMFIEKTSAFFCCSLM